MNELTPSDENRLDDDVFEELQDSAPRRTFRFSLLGKIGIAVVIFWIILAIIGPYLAPYGENDLPFPDDYSEWQPPRAGAWLGTDIEDRDVLSRLLYGASRTIGISFGATLLAYIFGIILGLVAAISRGSWLDTFLSRTVDAFISLPTILLALVLIAALGSSIPVLIFAAAFVYIMIVFRIARSIALDIIVMDYVEAARARGEGLWWILRREIWPNAAMPMISDFGLRLIYVILLIASLSFLGLGVQPPAADWGNMVKENLGGLNTGFSWWAALAPALAIASFTLAINFIIDDISAHSGGRMARGM